MLWTLLKVMIFVALVAAVAWGADRLLDTGAGIQVAAGGYEFTLGPLQAAIAALILVGLVWLLVLLVGLVVATLRFLNGDETALSRYLDRNRDRKGYQALSDAMVALASGEGRLALVRAARAEKYLARPELTTLIAAQAAEMAGDGTRAGAAYRALLADERTRFVGVRGLLLQTLAEGDHETALKLAEKAAALKPRHDEVQDILLRLQAGQADWKGARATLGAKARTGALPKDVYRRRDAVLALQEARSVMDDAASIEAREAAIEANRLSPDLIPAAAMAARSLAFKGDMKAAVRVLKKAWQVRPHPDLAQAFADLVPDETPEARLARFRTLAVIHPDDPETMMMWAELNIAAEDFPAARRSMADLAQRDPTARSLAIMAAIERGEGADEGVVRALLARALSAPRGPQWCCDKCQTVHAAWAPICDHCGGFDTLSWRSPPAGTVPPNAGLEFLPLVGPAPRKDGPAAAVVDAEPVQPRVD